MSKNFKIGDKVTVLDDNMDGKVVGLNGNTVQIETLDGFELSFNANELILLGKSTLDFAATPSTLQEVIKQKEIPRPRSFVKEKKVKEIPAPEFDLHIEKLVKNFRGMSNYEILTMQTETAKRHVEFAIAKRIPKIVLIHGVGEGVLKSELDFLLGRYENIDFRDADYQKYGLGATMIYIRQNPK